jgi:putative membrane protein
MEKVMDIVKKVLRATLATSAVLCLVSFGVAQDQGATSGSSGSQSSGPSQKSKKGSTMSSDSSGSSGQLSASDKQFVNKAAEGGMAEVQLGQIAAEKGNSAEVKQFGQRMVDDHSKANDQLKSLAQQKGVTLPADLNAKDKALKDKLSNMSGEQFDRTYMSHMVTDHKQDVAEFKKESTSGKDSEVKQWASQTLPTLEDHLKQAQQIASTEKSPAHAKAKKSATSASNPPQ